MTEEELLAEFPKRMRLYFELLYAEAKVDLPRYAAIYKQILDDLKRRYPDEFASVSIEVDVKPLDQLLKKVEILYRFDITKLADLVRARIVVKSTDQIGRFLEYLEKSAPANLIAVKNHFAVPTDTGYRNVWMLLETEKLPQIEFRLEQQDMLKIQPVVREIAKKQEALEFNIAAERIYWIAEPPAAEGNYQYFIFGQYIPVRGIVSNGRITFTEAPSLEEDNKLELAMEYMRAIRNDEDIVRVDREKFVLYCKQYRARRADNLYAVFKKFEKFIGKEDAEEMRAALSKPSTYGETGGIIIGARTFKDGLYKDGSFLHYEIADDGTLVFLFDSTKIQFEGGKKGVAIPIKAYKKATIWKALLPELAVPTLWDKDADCALMKAVRQHFQPKKGFGGTNHDVVFGTYKYLLDFVGDLGLLRNAVTQKITSA